MSLDEIRAITEVAIKAQRNDVYNAAQLCAKLGIAANTLRQRIVRGEIPPKQNGGNGAGFSEEVGYTQTKTDQHAVAYKSQVRRLMPIECERLQGFPDNYSLITHKGKPAADSPRYKALGNSWAVPVVKWIGERIVQVEKA
jgi:site-specific DNA-cytosine methylase